MTPIPNLVHTQHITEWSRIEAQCHAVESPYVLMFWLPTIGPSSYCLLRLLAAGAAVQGGMHVKFTDAARAIGLSPALGNNAPMTKTINRLERFLLLRRVGPTEWEVRLQVPNVPPKSVLRLPPVQRRLHSMWLEQPA